MKIASYLLAASVLTPVLIVIGLSATAAFSIATAVGISAIALNDYGHMSSYAAQTTPFSKIKLAERLPLAA